MYVYLTEALLSYQFLSNNVSAHVRHYTQRSSSATSSNNNSTIASRIFNNYTFCLSTIDTEKQFQENKRKKSKHWDKDGKLIPAPPPHDQLNPSGVPSTTLPPQTSSPSQHNYQSLSSLLLSHGSKIMETISPKSLHCLITTSSARDSLTQKIRKSIKRSVAIVDVEWVEECLRMGKVVDFEPYRREEAVRVAVALKEKEKEREKEKEKEKDPQVVDVQFLTDKKMIENAEGWTAPMSFGCSCVCHENHAPNTLTDCAWCPTSSCSINMKLCRECPT